MVRLLPCFVNSHLRCPHMNSCKVLLPPLRTTEAFDLKKASGLSSLLGSTPSTKSPAKLRSPLFVVLSEGTQSGHCWGFCGVFCRASNIARAGK